HRVIADEQVRGPIVVLHSRHDRALGTLYRALAGSAEVGRGRRVVSASGRQRARGARHAAAEHREDRRSVPGRLGHMSATVATSALGAVGARGVGAPDVDLVDAMTIGIPRYRIVNID